MAARKNANNALIAMATASMTSLEIADLVESRHDKVKQSIERLVDRGVIAQPPMGDVQETGGNNRTYITQVYVFNGERGKRDSIIVVAQLSPEFTARLVDRWQELEAQLQSQPTLAKRPEKLVGELAIMECFTRLLRPAPSSEVAMLAHIAKNHDLDSSFLPAYVVDAAPDSTAGSSMPTKPLTDLLAEHNITFTARAYNLLLREAGMLEERTRRTKTYLPRSPGKRRGRWPWLSTFKSPRPTRRCWRFKAAPIPCTNCC